MNESDHMTSSHYFPSHHGVSKESIRSTKLTPVFDASSNTSTEHSLNEVPLIGRKLPTDSCDILLGTNIVDAGAAIRKIAKTSLLTRSPQHQIHHFTAPKDISTLVTSRKAILASSPLTPLAKDSSNLAGLTPGHPLIDVPLEILHVADFYDALRNHFIHWQLVQAFHRRIWQTWNLEYLHTLQQRS